MKLHSRTQLVNRAGADIRLALINLQDEYGLTDVEMLRELLTACDTRAKWMLRAERHPDDPGKKADEE